MKWFIASLVLVAVAGYAAFVLIKRKSAKILSGDNFSTEPVKLKPQISVPKSDVSETVENKVAENPAESVAVVAVSQPEVEVLSPATDVITETKQAVVEQVEFIPEDSVLRRHYLSTQQALRDAMNQPSVSDSTLNVPVDGASVTDIAQPAVTPVSVVETLERVEENSAVKPRLPEDSTLRRHVLSLVASRLQDGLPPKPTDATLKRHYDSLLQAKVAEFLTENFS